MAKLLKSKRIRFTLIVVLLFFLLTSIAYVASSPKMVLNGEDNILVEYGQEYKDQGAHANSAGTHYYLPIQVQGGVDTETPGVYQITYCAEYKGRRVQTTRTVTVLAPGVSAESVLDDMKNP